MQEVVPLMLLEAAALAYSEQSEGTAVAIETTHQLTKTSPAELHQQDKKTTTKKPTPHHL